MLNSKVSQAVAAAIALGAAAGAGATTLSQVPAGNILYISGSTAISPVLVAYMVNSHDKVCDATQGAISVYTGTDSGGKFNAVACAAGSGITGVSAGTAIAIIKENNAGSKNGILPVEAPTTNSVSYPSITSTFDANFCKVGATTTPNGEQQQTAITCTGYGQVKSTATTGPYSALGFADVEAQIFGIQPTGVGVMSSVDTPFGIVVNLGLYHALQGAEGAAAETDLLANMPTLSRVQLAAFFQGNETSWNFIHGVSAQSVHFGNSNFNASNQRICWDGTTQNSTGANCQGGTQTPNAVKPHDNNFYFCERGQSSGTQQEDQIFFGNLGCAASMLTFATPTTGSCAASGCSWSAAHITDTVFAGNGQPDDLSCLEAHDEAGEYAVSFSSTDQKWGSTAVTAGNQATADWRFIRVDGYAPSNENIAAGKYNLWAQSAGYFAQTGAKNFPSGTELSLLNFFTAATTKLGGGTATAIDDALQRTSPVLDGGILAIPVTGGSTPNPSSASLTTFRANPVNGFLKNSPTNNCQPAYIAPNASDTEATPTWDAPGIQ